MSKALPGRSPGAEQLQAVAKRLNIALGNEEQSDTTPTNRELSQEVTILVDTNLGGY